MVRKRALQRGRVQRKARKAQMHANPPKAHHDASSHRPAIGRDIGEPGAKGHSKGLSCRALGECVVTKPTGPPTPDAHGMQHPIRRVRASEHSFVLLQPTGNPARGGLVVEGTGRQVCPKDGNHPSSSTGTPGKVRLILTHSSPGITPRPCASRRLGRRTKARAAKGVSQRADPIPNKTARGGRASSSTWDCSKRGA